MIGWLIGIGLIIFVLALPVVAWLGIRSLFQMERETKISLFNLSLKFGRKISRPCSVCGREVWLGVDGYDYNLITYCGKHKPPQLKSYYNL